MKVDYNKKSYAQISAIGGFVPENRRTNLDLENIDWVIVGGESGHKARPMKEKWVFEIRENCIRNNVPFFFKQWGGKNKKKAGRILDGKTYDEMPVKESSL